MKFYNDIKEAIYVLFILVLFAFVVCFGNYTGTGNLGAAVMISVATIAITEIAKRSEFEATTYETQEDED